MVFGWCGVAHIFLYRFSSFLPETGSCICHREETEVVFNYKEEVESMKEHGQRYPFEDPY